jgi:hypothetical protein
MRNARAEDYNTFPRSGLEMICAILKCEAFESTESRRRSQILKMTEALPTISKLGVCGNVNVWTLSILLGT